MTDTTSPPSPLAAEIATTVGSVLARAAHSADARGPQDAAEIQAITEAMVRLLVGVPLRSDGQLTVKSLADEAGLRRNKLTHKHTGLKDLFYALVKAQDTRPKLADDWQHENDELKAKLKRLREERDQLKVTVEQFARVIHILEVENDQLKKCDTPGATVHPLPHRT